MGMISKDANYNMDTALDEVNQKRLMLDLKVETQVVLQLLVTKGIVTREEVSEMRATVRNSPTYKKLYDYLDSVEAKAAHYKANPEEHLRDVFQAKLDGRL